MFVQGMCSENPQDTQGRQKAADKRPFVQGTTSGEFRDPNFRFLEVLFKRHAS